MEKPLITEEYTGHARVKYIFEYYETNDLSHLESDRIKQTYAVAFCGNEIVLVHNGLKDSWGLVGGSVEEGEKPEETLVRELKEESNMKVLDYELIGYQKVIDTRGIQKPFYQLRYFAIVEPYGPFEHDPAEIIDRMETIDPKKYKDYFDWGKIGDSIINKAIEIKRDRI